MNLNDESARHGEALHTRVMVALALSAIAEEEIRSGTAVQAAGSLTAIRLIIQDGSLHQ
jgi:hypothetical protein